MARVKQLPEYYQPITETYKQLEIGQEFKNYKEMCLFLCQPICGGTSKTSQLEQFKLYFDYETIGHKIIISEVYDLPLFNYSTGMYKALIQKLLMDMFVTELNQKKYKMLLSNNQIMEYCHMVNDKYKIGNRNRKIVKEDTNIPMGYIHEFYNNTNSKLIKTIESTLNSLRKGSYIHYNKVMAISENYKVRIAPEYIRRVIINKENMIYKEMGLEDFQSVLFCGKYIEFNEKVLALVNEELREEFMDEDYSLDYYYNAYDIVIGDRIHEEYERLDRYILDNKQEVLQTLNSLIVDKHKESYDNRHSKAFDNLLNDNMSKSDCYRINDWYVNNGHMLIDYAIKRRYIDKEDIVLED